MIRTYLIAGNFDEELFHLLMNSDILQEIPISLCTKYSESVKTFFESTVYSHKV